LNQKFIEIIEYFIDYTLTDDKNKLKEFLDKLSELTSDDIPATDVCVAHAKQVNPDNTYCFLGQAMSNQYRAYFRTCGGCPFFFSKSFLDALREYLNGDKAALSKILHEAEERKNMYIVNYYKNVP